MNCQEFWNTIPEEGSQDRHLLECEACVARMQHRQELRAGMRVLAGNMSHLEAPARVEARLISAFRAHTGLPKVVPVRRGWAPLLTWAAAFAATLAIGVFLMRNRTEEAAQPTAPAHMQLASVEITGVPESAVEEGYLPLPGAARLAPAEDVSVLHVELPRSAMMQVGIEVSPEHADDPVRADVMVGSDGLARAVRFVDVTGSDD